MASEQQGLKAAPTLLNLCDLFGYSKAVSLDVNHPRFSARKSINNDQARHSAEWPHRSSTSSLVTKKFNPKFLSRRHDKTNKPLKGE